MDFEAWWEAVYNCPQLQNYYQSADYKAQCAGAWKTAKIEADKLRTAIRNAGFAVLQTSGIWSIHDVSEKAKQLEANDLVRANRICDLEIECNRLIAEVERLTQENYRLAHDPHSDLLSARDELAKVTAERDALALDRERLSSTILGRISPHVVAHWRDKIIGELTRRVQAIRFDAAVKGYSAREAGRGDGLKEAAELLAANSESSIASPEYEALFAERDALRAMLAELRSRLITLPWDIAEAYVKLATDPERWAATADEIKRGIIEHYLPTVDACVAPLLADVATASK